MNKNVAFLWWENEVKWEGSSQPFSKDWKSKDYATYTEMLSNRDVNVFCGDYRWYSNGEMSKAWKWNGENWEKTRDISLNGVYDLFRHDSEKMRLKKRIKQEVGILNDPEVADLCQDKLKTYNKFKQHVPQTKEATEDNIRDMIEEFGKVIIKPRYGSSGEGIELIENVSDFEKPVDWDDILVQRFIQTSGIKELDVEGAHDLRVIIVNDEAIGSYLRIPAENQILSNVAQGGSKRYLSLEDIPKDAMNIVDEVASELEDYRPIIYTVDLMFAEGKPWIIELNSQPGIYYHGSGRKKDWEESWMKKVVDAVVELVKD